MELITVTTWLRCAPLFSSWHESQRAIAKMVLVDGEPSYIAAQTFDVSRQAAHKTANAAHQAIDCYTAVGCLPVLAWIYVKSEDKLEADLEALGAERLENPGKRVIPTGARYSASDWANHDFAGLFDKYSSNSLQATRLILKDGLNSAQAGAQIGISGSAALNAARRAQARIQQHAPMRYREPRFWSVPEDKYDQIVTRIRKAKGVLY